MEEYSFLLKDAKQIQNKSEIQSFLASTSFNKNSRLRILSWLYSLNIINLPFDSKKIKSLYKSYKQNYLYKYESNDQSSVSLSNTEENTIKQDLDRTIFWFNKLSNDIDIKSTKDISEFAYASSFRILKFLSLSDPFYTYLQGYDRYVFIFLLLGYDALKKVDNLAEAFAFYLTKEFLKVFNPGRYSSNKQLTADFFKGLDEKISAVRPDIYRLSKKMKISSVHYAMRWVLLSFADEHKLQGTLLLWDHIILNKNRYLDYISELCVGHVVQIRPVKAEYIIETIQKNQNWDEQQIITYANRHMVNNNRNLKILLIIGYIILLLVAFYYFSSKKTIM